MAWCKFSWAAQVFKCFSALGEPLPLVADAPIAIDINLLQELSLRDRLASFDSLPQDPRLAPSAGVNVCTCPAGLGAPKMQLAHLIGSHQWEMPNCTGFSGFAQGLITSQLRRAAF